MLGGYFMVEWENSFGGYSLKNARLLTKEEISKKYPITDNSQKANLTREFFGLGYDILYGEKPDSIPFSSWKRENDLIISALRTAAYIYKTQPKDIIVGVFTDLSEQNAIYVAVKKKRHFYL